MTEQIQILLPVADPGKGPESPPPFSPAYFWTKLWPEGTKYVC